MLMLSALCCFSCSSGPKLNPVEGKVIYKGQPLQGATVVFHLEGADPVRTPPAFGQTREDGTFSLTTGQTEGAAAGVYAVTITQPEMLAPKGKKGAISMAPPENRDALKGAFASSAKSKIKVEIKNGPNQLEPFDLK